MASLTPADRLATFSRIIAGVAGSYAVAAAVTAALARTLPLAPADAVVLATIIGVLVMPAAAIWAFLARSAVRGWAGLIVVGGVAALVAWLVQPA